jgi:hypothetical protein
MKDLVARVQRELPDTDHDRYDIAYERGRAQARSSLLLGGLAIGSAIGAGLMWLFDPSRGSGRRAQLASRAEGIKNDLARTAGGRADRDYGEGYREGFAQTEHDPMAPGTQVRDPIRSEEVAVHGASGPIAGAATTLEDAEERAADR